LWTLRWPSDKEVKDSVLDQLYLTGHQTIILTQTLKLTENPLFEEVGKLPACIPAPTRSRGQHQLRSRNLHDYSGGNYEAFAKSIRSCYNARRRMRRDRGIMRNDCCTRWRSIGDAQNSMQQPVSGVVSPTTALTKRILQRTREIVEEARKTSQNTARRVEI
jgi:hypothetical protein